MPGVALKTLAHHIDMDLLCEAHRRTRKDGAVGVDRQTADEYAEDLEGNLRSLLDRAKSGTYRAPAVRRVHIPKGDGSKTRPIGIPTFEDKILQRAVAMVLEAVYEQDFLDCSWGFRPGRSAHQALAVLREGLMEMGGEWVLEVTSRGAVADGAKGPATFDLLGFRHYWGRSLRGYWVVKRKTAGDRLDRSLRAVSLWCRRHRHAPVAEQHRALVRKLRGHYGYYGITGNSVAITRFRYEVRRLWRKWLNRRSGRPHMLWERFHLLEARYPLPPAIAVHSVYRHAANP
jgi:hypothetical protein